jgi:diadenosine tetraphosphate (Ap4A) HIT family hydrolase
LNQLKIMTTTTCGLCDISKDDVIFASTNWRVIAINDANYPGYCMVVWNAHVKEMTDLPLPLRNELMTVVWAVESVILEVMQPHKVNLAAFGNVVPHIHWHVIPRYLDDPNFPAPIWAKAAREDASELESMAARRELLTRLRVEIGKKLSA